MMETRMGDIQLIIVPFSGALVLDFTWRVSFS